MPAGGAGRGTRVKELEDIWVTGVTFTEKHCTVGGVRAAGRLLREFSA
jgi:hypothetical protein